jgi:D-serine deaminase-like pyridoxal phosphate-dependent protein
VDEDAGRLGLGPHLESFPPSSWGRSVADLVAAVNDQHAYLRLTASMDAPPVGAVVRLGMSHPCTVLDKWRAIPVVDDADRDRPRVVDAITTVF